MLVPALPELVVVHPLVLLSTVDHYNRVAQDTNKRVVGVLLGTTVKGKVDITNTYAVPFEEDQKDPKVWFLDHCYHENMYTMFRKVNAREKVVGWYSTGPKIRPADLEINELFRKYHPNPILVIIDVNPQHDLTIPTKAYCSVESAAEQRSENRQTFVHVPSEIGALEAEEVGVEHLLRDIRDTTVSSLANQVAHKRNSLKGLEKHMREMIVYLQHVVDGKLPPNHLILYQIQDIFNLSPNLRVEELVKAFAVKSNDEIMVVYLSSMIRAITALHDLINNKLRNKETADAKTKEKKDATAAVEKKDAPGAKDAGNSGKVVAPPTEKNEKSNPKK